MNSLVVCFAAFILIGALFLIVKAKSRTVAKEEEWPFYAKKPLSAPEQTLYFRLCGALPEHIILAQVGLSRLLGVKKGNNFQAWHNRINRMSADFVVCARDSSIVAVIELDDLSHEKDDHKARDAKKDKALGAAGIRVIRWQVKSLPDARSIRAAFAS
jgi:very-short-patch-repair endonuclease